MKQTIKRVALLFTAIFLLLACAYLHNTSVFKPINIYTGSGRFADSANIERHLTLSLYSPLGKKLDYTKGLLFTGSNARHAFISKVEVQISPYLYQNYQSVLITAGNDSCLLTRAAFAQTGEKYTAHVPLVNKGFWAKVLSVGRWAPVENLLFSLKCFVLQARNIIVVLAIIVWGVLLLGSILVLLFVLLTSSLLLLQRVLQKISPGTLAFTLRPLIPYLLFAANKTIEHTQGIFLLRLKYLWHINRITIILACLCIELYAYQYFTVFGSLHYVGWLTACFYFLLFVASFELWALFPRVNIFLSLAFTVVILAFADFALNFANINKHILERRQGFYLSQYHPLIHSWYYTRTPETNYCLCNIEYQFLRKANNEGLPDTTFTVNKGLNEIRIMGIGDSFTEGDGADKDSTYLKSAERILDSTPRAGTLKFLNAGTCGSDIVFEYQLLKDRLLKYKPDIVIAALNNSDVDDIMIRGGFERFVSNGKVQFRKGPWWEFLYVQSHVFRLIATGLLKADWILITDARKKELVPQSIAVIQQAAIKLSQLGKQNGFKFILLVHPFSGEWYEKKYRFDSNTLLAKTCRENSIDMYDALDFYTVQKQIADKDIATYYWKIDGHHNAKGYELLGEAAAYKLNQILSADSSAGQLHLK